VALTGSELLIAVALVAAGCLLTYVILRSKFRRAVSELQQVTERQLKALTSTVKNLETRVAELSQSPAIRPEVAALAAAKAEGPAPAAEERLRPEEEVTPEMLVVIAAAVTAFLGKKVRIRSAKRLQSPYEIVNPWSQQGRVRVQASHNLRSRG
jgi:methylmalonyl-CoA carboxyltransferase 12S subunit